MPPEIFKAKKKRAPKPAIRRTSDLRPLKKGEFLDNKDGTRSTELGVSFEVEGEVIYAPSLWMSNKGPIDLFDDFDALVNTVFQYERRTGKRFPRFKTEAEASIFGRLRSNSGGTFSGPLAK